MANRSDFGAFITGLFIGGLIGAGAALLFAPQSGEETREQIRQKGIELTEQASQMAEEARTKAETALTEARERLEKTTEEIQTRIKELEQQGRLLLEQQEAEIQEATDKVAAELS